MGDGRGSWVEVGGRKEWVPDPDTVVPGLCIAVGVVMMIVAVLICFL